MGDDDLRLVAKPVYAREDCLTEFRMPLDHDPLLGIERARLAQDRVGDPNLADVVQQPGAGQRSQRVVRELHRPPDLYRELRDPQVVTSRVLIACLDRGGQRRDGVDMFEFGADLDLQLQGPSTSERNDWPLVRCAAIDQKARPTPTSISPWYSHQDSFQTVPNTITTWASASSRKTTTRTPCNGSLDVR